MTRMMTEPLIDIEVEAEDWLQSLPDCETIVHRAISAALKRFESRRQRNEALDLVVVLTDDSEMQTLNVTYRAKDKPTNVLSFPPSPQMTIPFPGHIGDIALGFETCEREALDQGKSLSAHLSHLCVHGTLHLLGFDHETEAEAIEMEKLEREILAELGLTDPYAEAASDLSGAAR